MLEMLSRFLDRLFIEIGAVAVVMVLVRLTLGTHAFDAVYGWLLSVSLLAIVVGTLHAIREPHKKPTHHQKDDADECI